MPSDRVRQHRALTHEKLSAAMQHQGRLLLFRLRRHKSHRRSCHRLADGGSIVGVILATFEIGLHIARWHQPHRVTQRRKFAAPMMRGRTRLDTNQAGRQTSEQLQQLRPTDALADHHRAISVHAVNLKNRLRYIETDRDNLAHGRLPSSWLLSDATILWHIDAVEWAPSTASLASIGKCGANFRFVPDRRHASGHCVATRRAKR